MFGSSGATRIQSLLQNPVLYISFLNALTAGAHKKVKHT